MGASKSFPREYKFTKGNYLLCFQQNKKNRRWKALYFLFLETLFVVGG